MLTILMPLTVVSWRLAWAETTRFACFHFWTACQRLSRNMEGVAAFALACNVVQIIELSIQVAGAIQQTYSQGRSNDNARIQDISERLNALSQTLNKSLTVDTCQDSSTVAELQLQQIAPECSKITLELDRELDLLKVKSGKRNVL